MNLGVLLCMSPTIFYPIYLSLLVLVLRLFPLVSWAPAVRFYVISVYVLITYTRASSWRASTDNPGALIIIHRIISSTTCAYSFLPARDEP
jgi:hypothetical protein